MDDGIPPVHTSTVSRDGVFMVNEDDDEHSTADEASKGGDVPCVDDPSTVDHPSTAGRRSTIDPSSADDKVPAIDNLSTVDGPSTVGTAGTVHQSTVDNTPAAKTAPALDHKMFPHIMDLIVSFAPRESLFVLRRTSWDMCYLVDTLLARHIVVLRTEFIPPDDSEGLKHQGLLGITTPEGRLPLYYSLQMDSKTADFDQLPSENAKTVARAKMAFAKTSFFEVAMDIAFENLRMYDRKIWGLFTNVTDIKVNKDCWIQGSYMEQLIAIGLPSITSPQVFTFGKDDRVWRVTDVPAGTEGVRRTTLFLGETTDGSEDMYLSICGIDHSASLLEVFLIFDVGLFGLYDIEYLPHPDYPLGFLTRAMQNALPHLLRVRYTLVDLAHVPPKCLNLEDEVDAARLAVALAADGLEDPPNETLVEAAFYAKLEAMLRQKYPHSDEDVKIRLEAVKVITVDEYIEQVGRDRFDWETTFFFDP